MRGDPTRKVTGLVPEPRRARYRIVAAFVREMGRWAGVVRRGCESGLGRSESVSARCWLWRPGARTSMSSHVEVPVMAVRLAIVLKSARARRPDAERATPGRGVAGHGRKPFCGVSGSLDCDFLGGAYSIIHDRINVITEALMAGLQWGRSACLCCLLSHFLQLTVRQGEPNYEVSKLSDVTYTNSIIYARIWQLSSFQLGLGLAKGKCYCFADRWARITR